MKNKAEQARQITQVKELAFSCATILDAEKALPGLAERVKKSKAAADAWQRGRFLRELKSLATIPVSLDEAAERLGLKDDSALRQILQKDGEARDVWQQARHNAFIQIKLSLVKSALEGNQAAIRAVETFLKKESLRSAIEDERLKTADIARLTGRRRSSVYEWVNKNRLALDREKMLSLRDFFAWFEKYITEFVSAGFQRQLEKTNRLQAVKAEKLELDLRRHRHELLDRTEVVAGIVGRHQQLVSTIRQKAPQVAQLCLGQKPERIIKIITGSLNDICQELCQLPSELRLPERAAAHYEALMQILSGHNGESADNPAPTA